MKDVPKADADNIVFAINFIVLNGLELSPEEWESLLLSVASDGASVMTGSERGVLRQLTGNSSPGLRVSRGVKQGVSKGVARRLQAARPMGGHP
jgi:hypothetical protein